MVVGKKLVKSFIKGVLVGFVSKFDQFIIDAFQNKIVIVSHVFLTQLNDPDISAINGVIHPTFTRRWLESRAMKSLEVFTELLQFVH